MLGVIGGSGFYEIEGMVKEGWRKVNTPFGRPSDELLFGHFEGKKVVFLARHGRGHKIAPHDINYRANIYALKEAGVTQILSLSAVGSLNESVAPGRFVVVDQYIDTTWKRATSFFGKGLVAHVSMANPVCDRMGNALAGVMARHTIFGGTSLVIEGPQFATAAESRMYQAWGAMVIGMTAMPEAKLAREAEMCFANVAMVTDYDSWHLQHQPVSVTEVMKVMEENGVEARALIESLVTYLEYPASQLACKAGCSRSLDNAIITPSAHRDLGMVKKLGIIAGRAL